MNNEDNGQTGLPFISLETGVPLRPEACVHCNARLLMCTVQLLKQSIYSWSLEVPVWSDASNMPQIHGKRKRQNTGYNTLVLVLFL